MSEPHVAEHDAVGSTQEGTVFEKTPLDDAGVFGRYGRPSNLKQSRQDCKASFGFPSSISA